MYTKKESELFNKDKCRSEGHKTNPCFQENILSLKCLDDNHYDYRKCNDFFENYKTCKAFWGFVYKERKRKGISPYLPDPGDRHSVKEEYLPYFKR